MMIKRTTLFAVLMIICCCHLRGQEILSTSSGQKILLADDGTWTMTSRTAALDTDGNIVLDKTTGLDVFEIPTSNSQLTKTQERQISSLISKLEELEAMYRVALHFDDLELAKYDGVALSPNSDSSKNKERLLEERAPSKKQYAQAAAYLSELKKLRTAKRSKVAKKLTSLETQINKSFGLSGKAENVVAAQRRDQQTVSYPTSFDIENSERSSTTYDCNITFDGKDPVTTKDKREVASAEFFSFTQPKLKPYLKQDDFLKCKSSLTKVGKNYYLTLSFRLKSKEATKNYGQLSTDAEVRLEFINGKLVVGKNLVADNGVIEPYSGHTLYTGIYSISKDDLDNISKYLIDNVGIMWSSGFEQYDVYMIDLLMEQAKCLKNGK